jgi:hypothetical protein
MKSLLIGSSVARLLWSINISFGPIAVASALAGRSFFWHSCIPQKKKGGLGKSSRDNRKLFLFYQTALRLPGPQTRQSSRATGLHKRLFSSLRFCFAYLTPWN